MTEQKPAQKTRSKVAQGSKQISICGFLHEVLRKRAKEERRTIRTVVELNLLNALGYDSIDQLKADQETGSDQP